MNREERWRAVARRAAKGLGIKPKELILLRDGAGDPLILTEVMLAIEQLGAVPIVEATHQDYLLRLLSEITLDDLSEWLLQRQQLLHQVDRVMVLGGAPRDLALAPAQTLKLWQQAVNQLMAIESRNKLPFMLLAVPGTVYATRLNMERDDLEARLLPALSLAPSELLTAADRILQQIHLGRILTIRTYDQDHHSYELHLQFGDRTWLVDDGEIDDEDRSKGAIASNLPAGSIYTTVLENKTTGTIVLPQISGAPLNLTFQQGKIIRIDSSDRIQAQVFHEMLESHSGHSRRIGHLGIGLNPLLTEPIGWTIVDEHVRGAIFLSLGENRYMGGKNRSSLNMDFAISDATLLVDGKILIDRGHFLE